MELISRSIDRSLQTRRQKWKAARTWLSVAAIVIGLIQGGSALKFANDLAKLDPIGVEPFERLLSIGVATLPLTAVTLLWTYVAVSRGIKGYGDIFLIVLSLVVAQAISLSSGIPEAIMRVAGTSNLYHGPSGLVLNALAPYLSTYGLPLFTSSLATGVAFGMAAFSLFGQDD
jgi:hypothetical protein